MKDEVFLITLNEDLKDVSTEVFIYQDVEMCNFRLSDISWGNLDEDNIRIYHGVLVKATFIPENFKGCTPYIIIKNPEGGHTAVLENECFFEKVTADPVTLANRIQKLLEDDELFISSTYLQQLKPTIENVKIFFGQRQTPVFQISEDNLDEEVMGRLNDLSVEFETEKYCVMEEINENQR
jgi:hypothetical protein